MAIESMKKVAIFGLSEEFSNIAHGLQRLSMLHITSIESLSQSEHGDGGKDLTSADGRLLRVGAALDALKSYRQKKPGLLSNKPRMTESSLASADNAQNWDAVEEILQLCQQLPSHRSHLLQLNGLLEALAPYENLAVNASDLRSSAHTFMAIGSVADSKYQDLFKKCADKDIVLESVGTYKNIRSLLVVSLKNRADETLSHLREAGFTEANFRFTGTVLQEKQRLCARIGEVQGDIDRIEASLRAYAQGADALEMLYDHCSILQQRAALALESARTGKAFYLTGWVKKRQADALSDKLRALSDKIIIEFLDIQEGEIPPTAMNNSRLLRPFESVTEMYSSPSPFEADPTFVMAPFFLCFFGMMVSDAAYGIILTVLSILMLKLLKPSGMMAQITAIIAMGGVSTLLWGAVFGSWFGEALLPPLWMNPIEQPIPTLLLCLGLGMVHITAGILMKAKALLLERKVIDAIFDCGFVLCVLWGAAAAFAGMHFGLTVVYCGLVGLFLTAGRSKKGILKKFTGGFAAVYGLSSYLSDVLSYARLFGMGIATGVIAMVFNIIAGMLMGTVPGFILAVAVLIIGHGFNIAINTLGAYVHSCRLQYIEFYNKFFEGGGRAFVPFMCKTKYVQLIQG